MALIAGSAAPSSREPQIATEVFTASTSAARDSSQLLPEYPAIETPDA